MASTLGDFLAHARETIAALTPATDRGTIFRAVDGLLSIEGEPVVSDRAFEIRVLDGGELGPLMDSRAVEWVTPIEVRVHYDHRGDHVGGLARLLEDASQIRGKLLQRASWGDAKVALVRSTGLRREPGPQHFEDLVLSFEVSHVETLP